MKRLRDITIVPSYSGEVVIVSPSYDILRNLAGPYHGLFYGFHCDLYPGSGDTRLSVYPEEHTVTMLDDGRLSFIENGVDGVSSEN
jgi:hypothetical protein